MLTHFFDLGDFAHAKLFEGCTYPWEALLALSDYLKAQNLGKIEGTISEGVFLIHPESISIGPGTVVESGAYIQGPCIIGPKCIVRHGAYIRGNVVTGKGCVLGHASEFKNSILLNRAAAPHFNYVGDSILGNDVNLGAGAICANVRFDRHSISVHWEGEKIKTPLKKLGAILGDRTQIGCNCVLNPGTLLGKESVCFPAKNTTAEYS